MYFIRFYSWLLYQPQLSAVRLVDFGQSFSDQRHPEKTTVL